MKIVSKGFNKKIKNQVIGSMKNVRVLFVGSNINEVINLFDAFSYLKNKIKESKLIKFGINNDNGKIYFVFNNEIITLKIIDFNLFKRFISYKFYQYLFDSNFKLEGVNNGNKRSY